MAATLTTSDCRASVTEAIQSAVESLAKAGELGRIMTEAMTEMIVIDKILCALGYEPWEIQKQGVAEGIGNIPDYSLLPNTPHQWFLEVKKWQQPLTEKDASQAVTYASNQGKRWAVLTNGDEWRIFDAYSTAHLSKKCILSLASITLPDAVDFFALLSKAAIFEDKLAASYRARIIKEAVVAELSDPASGIIRRLGREVERKTGLASVKKEEVLLVLSSLLHQKPLDEHPIPEHPTQHPIDDQATVKKPQTLEPSLLELSNKAVSPTFRKPIAVLLPDGTEVAVGDWRDVITSIVSWTLNQYGVPSLPLLGCTVDHVKLYFLNNAPVHSDGTPWRFQREIEVAGKTVFIHMHGSAYRFCRRMYKVVTAVGGDPSSIRIRLM